jgi:UDP-glucose:(heptosyl)LPS alpha-1,3-glucosyltransferase
MKILIVCRQLNFHMSAPKCSIYLASELAKLGIDTHILTSKVTPLARKSLEKVTLHKVNPIFANKILSPFFYTNFAHRLKNKYSFDIIFGNGYTFFDDISWVHLPGLASIKRLGLKGWRDYFRAQIEKLLFKTSRLLLAPSSIVAEDLKRIYDVPDNRIKVQCHGVDTEYYIPPKKRMQVKAKSCPNVKDKICLLFVGTPFRKGFHLLLRALAYNMKHSQDLELIAIGFKPTEELRSLIAKLGLEKIVSFKGIIQTEELKMAYQSSDIFILPSLYDPFSLATLEAMSSGLPVIISQYVGAKDIIENWHNGVIIDPYDISKFADAINTLINNDKLRKEMGVNARATAENYSWKNVAKRILEICEYA